MAQNKKGNSAPEDTTPPKKESIEEILEDGAVLSAEAEIEDAEAEKQADAAAKIPEVEVDLDAEREKTKQEALDAVAKDIIEPLKQEIADLKQTLTPQEEDDYDKFVREYTEQNGKAPEWKQLASFFEERAVTRLKSEQQAEQKAKDDEAATQKAKSDEQATQNFTIWEAQLAEMADTGMIPKMGKAEVGDPGFDAKVKLYGLMQNTWKTTSPSTNMYEVMAKYYDGESNEADGADAPVSMGQQGGPTEDKGSDYKYSDVHRGARDLEGFILEEMAKVQG